METLQLSVLPYPAAAGDNQGRIKFDGLSSSAGDYVPRDLAFTSR